MAKVKQKAKKSLTKQQKKPETKPKKRINVKRKGNDFERAVAKFLSQITLVEWKRVPQSGAAATTGAKPKAFLGDVYCNEELHKYANLVVETKATKKKITLSDVVNTKSTFWKWMFQAEKESAKKPFLLVFKDGTHKVYMGFFFQNEEEAKKRCYLPYKLAWETTTKIDPDFTITAYDENRNVYVAQLWEITVSWKAGRPIYPLPSDEKEIQKKVM